MLNNLMMGAGHFISQFDTIELTKKKMIHRGRTIQARLTQLGK
jgi:hypothetical protein